MHDENHSLWFYITSKFISTEHVEYPRLHNCHDWVRNCEIFSVIHQDDELFQFVLVNVGGDAD